MTVEDASNIPPAMPPRPEGFVCRSVDAYESGFPKRLPNGAIPVASFEWGSPGSSGYDDLWLSINRKHTLWLLWFTGYDEEIDGRRSTVCACGPYMKIPPKTAATYLVLAHWDAYGYSLDYVIDGLLTSEELKAIAQELETKKSK